MKIVRPDYTLEVNLERPKATLFDAEGREWSQLSLVGSADRLDARDETLPGITTNREDDGEFTRIVVEQPSSAWESKRIVVDCLADRLEVRLQVSGKGALTDVSLLGGRLVLPNGACGTFSSSVRFRSVFVPTPTEPIAVARPSSSAAVLSVVGDADPGRLHGIFSPPPLCLAFGRETSDSPTLVPGGDWLACWVADEVERLRFTELHYQPLDGGFRLVLDHEGHTVVDGEWTSPAVVLKPTASAWQALADYAEATTPATDRGAEAPEWWSRPIFCGWGAQCARAAQYAKSPSADDGGMVGGSTVVSAAALAAQRHYDEWLARLAEHGVEPGTIVLDDKWQADYGSNTPDPAKWPDLKGWIAEQHEQGRKVLLWFKAWDPAGLPPEQCITDRFGTPVAADPGNAAYQARLAEMVHAMLSPEGLDADGFKADFTQRVPSGSSLSGSSESSGVWGVAALHALLHGLYRAAKSAKPDALVITHSVNPLFTDCNDMVRLNDVLRWAEDGSPVGVVEQLRFRQRVATSVLPDKLIDTDQWPMPDRDEWLGYVEEQWKLGVPALYYLESIDNSGEQITSADLERVRETWEAYGQR